MALKILGGIAGLVVILFLFVSYARRASSTVHIEHTFNAPVDKVWKIWNDPETMKKWWGPKDYTAPVIKNDLRVGGSYLLSMRSPKGEMFYNTGTYKEVVLNKRIVSTLSFADETGKPIPGSKVPVPGHWPDYVTITFDFTEMDGKTKVAITEEGVPLIMKVLARMGWEQQFVKFDTLI